MNLNSIKANNFYQWALVICTPVFYLETLIMFLILLTTKWKGVLSFMLVALIIAIPILLSNLEYGYSLIKPMQQIALIGLYFIGYCTFCRRVDSIELLWSKYLKYCYWLGYVCLFQLFCLVVINKDPFAFAGVAVYGESSLRLHAYSLEPSYLGAYLLPYVIYSILNWTKVIKREFLLVFFAFILTLSTTSFLVLFLFGLYRLFVSKYRIVPIILVPSFLLITSVFWINMSDRDEKDGVSEVVMKINDTVGAFADLEPVVFEQLNASTYATMTNLWVALNAPNRIIGTGLGTHEQSYVNLYTSSFSLYGLNKEDAYSLGTRALSECGVIGLLALLFFLVFFFNRKNSISVATAFYLIAIIIRGGHYTANGVFFFMMLFLLSSRCFEIKRAELLSDNIC